MLEKSLKSIEYTEITKQLSDLCTFEENKQTAVNLKPFTDIDQVRENLLMTDTVTSYILKYGKPSLDSAPGAKNAVVHSQKGAMLSCAELLEVARMYRNFDRIKKWYFQYERNSDVLDWNIMSITENSQLEKIIFESILSENQIADTASDTLYDIRRRIKSAQSAVREKLENIIRSPQYAKFLQEAVVTIRQNKFVVPVKAEYRGEINGTVHDVSSSGSTYFIEPAAIVELNGKIMQLLNEEQDEINKILTNLSNMVSQSAVLFFDSYEKLLLMDMVTAKARLAINQDANMPKVNSNLCFSLKKSRHPLIDKKKVVPTDIELGYDYDTMIITGPNTGGKTVSLKTAGLLNAMACTGMLIPAHETSSVCVFSKILVDIGDEQSIQQSLSTFSGHMKNIGAILQEADENSLVLMDELGAGTDPAEGAALALSIIEKLREKGCKVMATTHYGELKVYALETQGVQNASCEFDTATLTPTYRIIMGIPGKSNAFYISKKLGIQDDIIKRAKQHLSGDEKRLGSLLSQLEELKLKLKQGQEEIQQLKTSASDKIKQAQEKSEEIIKRANSQAQSITQKAKNEAQKVQDEAYRLSDELKQLQKQENVAAAQRLQQARKIAQKETAKLIAKVDKEQQEEISLPKVEKVKKGDKVVIGSLNKQAVVQSEPNKDGMVDVVAGIIKTKVHISDLYQDLTPAKTNKSAGVRNVRQNRQSGITSAAQRSANTEINVIGLTVDEAIIEVDRFLDNCFMNRFGTVYIIHGKGTGALRNGIHAFLRKHKHVRSFRLGVYGEGETGVTVAELK